MKDPEQVRRIRNMASTITALECMQRTYLVAGRHVRLVLPSNHHAHKAMLALYEALDKAHALCEETMAYLETTEPK